MDGAKVVGAPGGEGVLANFFNSLLHKKSGSPSAPLGPSSPKTPGLSNETSADKLTMRSDAAAELDRLARTKKPTIDLNSSDC